MLSGSGDGTVRVWGMERGEQVAPEPIGHTSEVTCVEESADGRRVVSGSRDCTVRVWDPQTGMQGEPALVAGAVWTVLR